MIKYQNIKVKFNGNGTIYLSAKTSKCKYEQWYTFVDNKSNVFIKNVEEAKNHFMKFYNNLFLFDCKQ